MMRSYKINAITVARRNFLEKDRVLTLFSLEYGKIDVLAKGARRPGSKLSYASDLGTLAQFVVAKTRSIDIATEAKTIFLPEQAFDNLPKANKIFYSLKIIKKLYREDESHPRTYYALAELLRSIARPESQLNFLIFLRHVIADLGVTPELGVCVFCAKTIGSGEELDFNLEGGISHKSCDSGDKIPCSLGAVKLMRLLFAGDQINASSRVSKEFAEEVYQILRSYLNWHFEEILPESAL